MSENFQKLKNTPLYEKHIALGARMVPFAGWNMPVQYTGIIEEHLHTRSKAGIFDICHMGEIVVKGSVAARDLENLITCSIEEMPVGRCRYGFLLNESGGIIDDLIVFKTGPYDYMLVVNASTIDKDLEWIRRRVSSTTSVEDISSATAKIDLQGPLSEKVLSALIGKDAVEGLKRYWFTHSEIFGAKTLVSRTGYTGEAGFEFFLPNEAAGDLWDKLLSFEGVKPIGLGARDTLRLEMGYSLYGNDIDEAHNPLEANLERFVRMDKDFIGRPALERRGRNIPGRLLIGFVCDGRRAARAHFEVRVEGEKAGEVTSGAFSPCLKLGIGLAYLERQFAVEGKEIILTDGKTVIAAKLKKIPLYERV